MKIYKVRYQDNKGAFQVEEFSGQKAFVFAKHRAEFLSRSYKYDVAITCIEEKTVAIIGGNSYRMSQ